MFLKFHNYVYVYAFINNAYGTCTDFRVGQLSPVDLFSGSSFPARTHRIVFIAYDNAGNSAICDFSFTVIGKFRLNITS